VGRWPYSTPKFIITVAPHTSNWDFVLGVVARGALGAKTKFIGKQSLFVPPYGWFFRWLGGVPVDRSKKNNLVAQVVKMMSGQSHFILAIAPEGTRKHKGHGPWKTGFYYIALGAGVPIVMTGLDYAKKQVIVSPPLYLSGNFDKDIELIRAFYQNITGKEPLTA